MSRRCIPLLIVALAACTADGNVPVLCEDDGACPFEQCCVRGACVDPGPGGACSSAAISSSSLVVTPATIVAGQTTDVRITVRDAYGRPIANSGAEVLIQSTCNACDTIASDDWTTDASGTIKATFSSTGSGTKVLTLRVGSTLATPTLVQVVPDVAVSVGFASAIADTPIGTALAQVAVTRLDIYGNPDAVPADPSSPPTKVEIQLEVNAAGLQLVDPAGIPISAAARTIELTNTRMPVDDLHVPFVAYNQRLVAFDASETPLLAASQSNLFDITVPHVTSTTADVLSAGPATPATLDWSVTPATTPTQIHEGGNASPAVAPLRFTPLFNGESPALTHVRIRPEGATGALDVEATRMGIARAFAPSRRNGSQVNILDIKRFPTGDLLVVGTFTYDMLLGERGATAPVVTAVLQVGLEGFIARFDPTARTVKWVDLFYGVDAASRGINVTIKDTDIVNGDVLALAEFPGAGAGWRFDKPGQSGELIAQQCTLGSAADTTSYVSTVARLDALTGVVKWCSGIHDPDVAPPSAIKNARAGVIGSLNTETAYVAVRVQDPAHIYPGRIVNGATPAPRIDAPAAGTLINKVYPASEHDNCAGGFMTLVPVRNGALDATRDVIATGIAYEPTSMYLDSDLQGFVMSGNACSNGGADWDLEIGRAVKVDTDLRQDGSVLRVNTPLTPIAGARLQLLWQSHGVSTDRLWEARPYLGDVVIQGDFFSTITFDSTVVPTYAPGLGTTYVARIGRTPSSSQVRWYRQLGSSGANVTPYGLSISGDRIVAVAQSVDEVLLLNSPHRVIDMNDEIPDPVGLLFELDGDGEPRWSSPFLGTTRPSHPIALTGGSVIMGLCGLQGSVIGAALDAVPLRQVIQRGGRYEPILGLYTPYDFVVRDIVLAP